MQILFNLLMLTLVIRTNVEGTSLPEPVDYEKVFEFFSDGLIKVKQILVP